MSLRGTLRNVVIMLELWMCFYNKWKAKYLTVSSYEFTHVGRDAASREGLRLKFE